MNKNTITLVFYINKNNTFEIPITARDPSQKMFNIYHWFRRENQ